MILDHVNDIAAICAGHGVKTAIISPGSRSAPLTLAFARHPDIETKVISDERSAAFIALGMAQVQQKPIVLICTSGSAAYNYAPAVAEAFFQQIPLLILTADRPPEWIDQYDGQTIRQTSIYGNHVKKSFNFPDNPSHPDIIWHTNRMVNEALIHCHQQPLGPVHINVPLREPFYPDADEKTFFRKVRLIEPTSAELCLKEEDWTALVDTWKRHNKRLLVGGQTEKDAALVEAVDRFSATAQTPVISDIISNLHEVQNAILHQDAFLRVSLDEKNTELQPDLLITFGKSNISKNLKRFLRKYKPAVHWHIQPHSRYQDTFQSLTRIIHMEPTTFFEELSKRISNSENDTGYLENWQANDALVAGGFTGFFSNQPFGEFQAVQTVIHALPKDSLLHLSNSMAVRYANFVGLKDKEGLSVCCNRGTSGIDGSNSTAVGAALAQDKMVTLITGDMAFFYDRNAFWNQEKYANLRIILLNNQAGGIFRLIKGPSDQPELEEYFETKQSLNASHLASEFDFGYRSAHALTEVQDALKNFYAPAEQPQILEIFTDSKVNARIFKAYWSFIDSWSK